MEIEITRDWHTMAMESTTILDGRWRAVPDGSWIRSLRRNLKLPELKLFYNRLSRNFVLGGWVIKGKCFIECVAYRINPGEAPGFDARSNMDWLRWRFRPVKQQGEEAIERGKRRFSHEKKVREDDLQQRTELVDRLRRRGMHDTADSVEGDGTWVGEHQGGETLKELQDNIRKVQRGTLYSI